MPLRGGRGGGRKEGGGAAAAIFANVTAGGNVVIEDVAEARVYVNNMNTPRPAVGIPNRGTGGARSMGRAAAVLVERTQSADGREHVVDGGKDGGGPAGKAAAGGGGGGGGAAAARGSAAATVNYNDHTTGKVVTHVVAPPRSASAKGNRDPSGAPSEQGKTPLGGVQTNLPADEDTSLHPNLEAIYSRVMRRLQRELNYEELHRVSLADQYGVALDFDEGGELPGSFQAETSTGTDAVLGGAAAAAAAAANKSSPSGGVSSPQSHSPQNQSTSRYPGGATAQDGSGHTSMIIRYGRRQNSARSPTNGNAGGSFGQEGVGAGSLGPPGVGEGGAGTTFEDIEQALASQPCPRTLRLVLQQVQKTLLNKMAMAERGSMKDCLRLTFESRALLDRLLKEAPTYIAFPEDPDSLPFSAGRRGTSPRLTGHKLQEMYQEFRRKPVLLPKAGYTQDRATGAVDAALDFSQEVALGLHPNMSSVSAWQRSTGPGAGEDGNTSPDTLYRPSTAVPPPPTAADGPGSKANANNPKGFVSHLANVANEVIHNGGKNPSLSIGSGFADAEGGGGSGAVVLPATYGKSSRRANASSNTGSGLSQEAHTASQNDSTQSVSRTNDSQLHCGSSTAIPSGNVSVPTMDTGSSPSQESEAASGKQGHSHVRRAKGVSAALSVVSVGTITDENASNTITQEAYDDMKHYAQDLEVQLAEARSTHDDLTSKLLYEESYVDSRRRVMSYLRETLIRECNMLRSQLSFAVHREHQLQQTIREKQQAITTLSSHNNTNANSNGVGNGNGDGVLAGSPSRSFAGPSLAFSRARNAGGGGGNSIAFAPRQSISVAGMMNANEESCSHISAATASSPGVTRAAKYTSSTNNSHNANTGAGGNASTFGEANNSECGADANGGRANAHLSTTAAALASHDITSMQSLLDLVLLAVENDEVFPTGLGSVRALGPELVKHTMTKDLKHEADALRAQFEEKSRRLQDAISTQRIRNNYTIIAKDKEIARLEKLTDLSYVEKTLREKIADLRMELRKLRNQVQESLQGFRIMQTAVTSSILNRARVMDQTASDNAVLQNTQDALKDLIEAAYSLLSPMLTTEYAQGGYHPWPLKLRNTTDPLAHIIKSRYGPAEVVRLREQLTTLSEMYIAIHKFVTRQTTYPDPSHPLVGEPLRLLCSRLVLNTRSATDVIFEVRQRYDREMHLQRAIAKLSFRLLWNVYLQRAYTERAVSALTQARMDPYTTTLPVARQVNELAALRGSLTHQRNTLLKERLDNAKHVYRLWREKDIDIYNGFGAPQTGMGARLTVLSEARLTQSVAPPPPRFSIAGNQHAGSSAGSSHHTNPQAPDDMNDAMGEVLITAPMAAVSHRGRSPSPSVMTSASRLSRPNTGGQGSRCSSSPYASQVQMQAQAYLGEMVERPMTGKRQSAPADPFSH